MNLGNNIDVEVLESMVAQGFDMHAVDRFGCNLYWSAQTAEAVQLLLDLGVSADLVNHAGETPLFDITDVDIARLYVDAGVNVNHVSKDNETVLSQTVMYSSMDVFNVFMSYADRFSVDTIRHAIDENRRYANMDEYYIDIMLSKLMLESCSRERALLKAKTSVDNNCILRL